MEADNPDPRMVRGHAVRDLEATEYGLLIQTEGGDEEFYKFDDIMAQNLVEDFVQAMARDSTIENMG